MKFKLPTLPWSMDALEPMLSRDAVECHYYGHHKAYIDKVNALVDKLGIEQATLERIVLNHDGEIFNSAAQAWNHTFFWHGLSPRAATPTNSSPLGGAIAKSFDSIAGLRERFLTSAKSLFGSGWTWIVLNDFGDIEVVNTPNAETPLRFENVRPLWVCDVWEHAYYIDYRNKRADFLEGIWAYVNWDFVATNLANDRLPNMTQFMTAAPGQESLSLT